MVAVRIWLVAAYGSSSFMASVFGDYMDWPSRLSLAIVVGTYCAWKVDENNVRQWRWKQPPGGED